MKRTERHHLKHNDLVDLAARSRQVLEQRQGQITAAIVAILVIAAAGIGYYGWRGRVQGRAHTLLSEAMIVSEAPVGPADPKTPDTGLRFPDVRAREQASAVKFKAAADQYPSTDAGLFARYREAATQMALGSPAEAAKLYQLVIDRAGDGIYGQMARLGLAEAQAREGKFDQAIAIYKDLADRKDGSLPVDGVLMQLGRVYLDAGKTTEAQQAFNRLVQEFPESSFIGDARQELDTLKKT